MRTWTFQSAGSLLFGRNSIDQLPDIAAGLDAKRIFIVTDAILEKAGVVEKVSGRLKAAGVLLDTFHVNNPEPSVEIVRQATAQAKGFAPDAVLGLGGGSTGRPAAVGVLIAPVRCVRLGPSTASCRRIRRSSR